MEQQTFLACSQCGRTFADSDLVQIAGTWVCGDCKPAFLSRVMAHGTAGTSPLGWSYGGFWVRFGARFIDNLILMVPFLIVGALLIPNMLKGATPQAPSPALMGFILSMFVVFFLVAVCYEVLMLRYRGATLGKMACGLKVVCSDGRSLGWGVSIGRFFMWHVVTCGIPYLNFVLMLVSSIMMGVDDEKRTIHDRVCDTRVVYKQSIA